MTTRCAALFSAAHKKYYARKAEERESVWEREREVGS